MPADARPATDLTVTKRDGSTAPYDGGEIAASIEHACRGLDGAVTRTTQLLAELEITLFDGITTAQLDEAVVQVALQNVKDDPAYDTIAARLLLKSIYKRVLGGDGTRGPSLRDLHRAGFAPAIEQAVAQGQLDERLGSLFDLDRLAAALDPERDDLLRYIGVATMRTRYLLDDRDGSPLEVPQYFWMRVAMGLSLTEPDPTGAALACYDAISRLSYLPAGSTLVNAGTSYPQLSNCFVMEMHDDIEHIAKSLRDVMWLTKGTGGIGLSVTKLRAEGSPIRSNNTTSTGPIPFMHTIDSTLRAVSRGGKKFGALCFYLENWHFDFPQFLDLRQNAGDPYRRTRTANTAVWISDEFMKRVADDDDWYLFDPLEVPDLTELYGAEFSRRYAEYAAAAERGELRAYRKLRAREQYTAILVSLQTTSHPWLTWKDTINNRALNDNTGTIHLSNLCTEICLPQDRDNVAVCNLASINLARHVLPAGHGLVRTGAAEAAGHVVVRPDKPVEALVEALVERIDWAALRVTVRQAVRGLDNLVDITISSVPEAAHSNDRNRAVGLGVMGFTDLVEQLGLSYESEAAFELADRLLEFISYHAIDCSADLARERGAYPNFAGSGWSRGLVPIDTIAQAERARGVPIDVDRTERMDWDALRTKVRGGIRNATLLAIAPTASIGLVAGTTPGLDPQFSQIFSRATSSGKFLEVNRNLVADLKKRGLWESVRDELLRQQGDLSAVPGVPNELRHIYRTSFQLSPHAFIDVAARAQKWIDQAISRNIYLETRDVAAMADLYAAAWRKGVKTTYYLHMKPRHTAEQSTVRVNKAELAHTRRAAAGAAGARRGFGFGATTPTAVASPPAARPTVAEPALAEQAVVEPDVAEPALAEQAVVEPDVVEPALAEQAVVEPDVVETADGAVACPVDPQERLECDSCQ